MEIIINNKRKDKHLMNINKKILNNNNYYLRNMKILIKNW
jgi:hypothetical protein